MTYRVHIECRSAKMVECIAYVVQTLSRSYQAQEDEFLKRAVMMAAGRRAGKQGGAALPLSGDEVRRKIEAAKAQMDTGAYRRRG